MCSVRKLQAEDIKLEISILHVLNYLRSWHPGTEQAILCGTFTSVESARQLYTPSYNSLSRHSKLFSQKTHTQRKKAAATDSMQVQSCWQSGLLSPISRKSLSMGESPHWIFLCRNTKTKQYDKEAMVYLSYALYPILIGYALYALKYETHKSWYSWILNSLVGAVYTFGFILMCPQVSHLLFLTCFYCLIIFLWWCQQSTWIKSITSTTCNSWSVPSSRSKYLVMSSVMIDI